MLPKVIIHVAVSVDGRIDWISPDLGLFYGLISRWNEDATLAGSDTILKAPEQGPDDAASGAEPPAKTSGDRRPLLVVPDSRGRIKNWNWLRGLQYWREGIALCSRSTPCDYLDYLDRARVEYIVAGEDHVDYRAALEELSARFGVGVVRVDSGGTLNGALLRAGLVDEVSVLVHPSLVGGTTPRSLFRAPDLTSAEGVVNLELAGVEQPGNGVVWLRYDVVK